MEQDLLIAGVSISLHRPDPPMPDVEPDPLPPGEGDDIPPDLPEPYRHPEGDPPEHAPPEHEPPERQPPVHAPPMQSPMLRSRFQEGAR